MEFSKNGRAMFIMTYGELVENNINIGEYLVEKCKQEKRPVEASEVRSWKKSMAAVMDRFSNCNISKDTVIMCEYDLSAGFRTDWMAIGTDKMGVPTIIIGENKQWTSWHLEECAGLLTAYIAVGNGAYEKREHPIPQLEYYQYTINTYINNIRGLKTLRGNVGIKVLGMVYLHNTKDASEFKKKEKEDIKVFSGSKEDIENMESMLEYNLCGGDKYGVAKILHETSIRPQYDTVNMLIDAIICSGAINGVSSDINFMEKYGLNPEQYVAVESCAKGYVDAKHSTKTLHKKTIVAVEGGAGSGKTCESISLFFWFLKNKADVKYSVKSSEKRAQIKYAVKKVLDERFGKNYSVEKKNAEVEIMKHVVYIGNGLKEPCAVLIIDEAQTLHKYISVPVVDNEGNYVMNGSSKVYRDDNGNPDSYMLNNLDMVSEAAFIFYDEHQKDEPQCFLTTEAIREYSKNKMIDLKEIELKTQSRCGDIPEYCKLIKRLLFNKYDGSFKMPKSNKFKVLITYKYGDITYYQNVMIPTYGVKNCHINAMWSNAHPWNKDHTIKSDFNNLYYYDVKDGKMVEIPVPMNWNFRPSVSEGKSYRYSEDGYKTVGYLSNIIGSEYDAVYLLIPRCVTYNKEEHCVEVHDELNGRKYTCSKEEFYTSIKELMLNELYVNLTRANMCLCISCEDEKLRDMLAYFFQITEFV